MPIEFGTPKAGDHVAMFEEVFNKSIDKGIERVERSLERFTRPLGSERVNGDEELAEYVAAMADNREVQKMWLDQKAAQVGRPKAEQELAEMVNRNEKRIREMAE